MDAPFVSIIVLSWNGRSDTLECLRSLSDVDYPRYEVVVVDNASTDGTVEAVRREFPGVQVIRNDSNLRYAGGNNVGIREALGRGADCVLLLNNDTVVDRMFLRELVSGFSAVPGAGIAGPMILYHADPRRIWYAGGEIDWWGGWLRHTGIRLYDDGRFDGPHETSYVSGCCLLMRRNVIEKIGLLDESYFIYGEDADWCIRARRAGYPSIVVPSARIWHKVSASSGRFSWFKQSNKLKSQLRLMVRYARWYHWLTIPFVMPWNYFRSALVVARQPQGTR